MTGGMASNSFEKRNREADVDGFFVMPGEGDFQLGGIFVPEHDVEEVVVDDFLDAIGDALEKFVAGEDGGQFAADVKQQREGLVLLNRGNRRMPGWGLSRGIGHGENPGL